MSSIETRKPDHCVDCGETVDLLNAPDAETLRTAVLVQSDDLCVTRMAVAAGQELPPQRSLGDATVQCLEGRVDFIVDDETHSLTAGRLVYLGAKMPYAIVGVEDSVLLITMVVPNDDRPRKRMDVVEEASEESFPASDPPAHG